MGTRIAPGTDSGGVYTVVFIDQDRPGDCAEEMKVYATSASRALRLGVEMAYEVLVPLAVRGVCNGWGAVEIDLGTRGVPVTELLARHKDRLLTPAEARKRYWRGGA